MTNKEDKDLVEKIKSEYEWTPKTPTKVEDIKALDKKVKQPALIFGLSYGIAGSLVLGTGMTLAMKIIGASVAALMPVGIVVGLAGIGMMVSTYPIYNKILEKRKNKYKNQILEKSNEVLGSDK